MVNVTVAWYFYATSELGLLRRARTERAVCAQGVSIPYETEGQNAKLVRFFHFAGVSPSSTEKDVRHLYGDPEDEHHSYLEILTFLNDALEIHLSEGGVSAVKLRNRFALLGGPGIDEPLSIYLGSHVSNALEEFGLPHSISGGRFKYRFSSPGKTGTVEFTCYDFEGCRCREIEVRWRVL